jgi:hypothetical protein
MLRVARTIADLAGVHHVSDALLFRQLGAEGPTRKQTNSYMPACPKRLPPFISRASRLSRPAALPLALP